MPMTATAISGEGFGTYVKGWDVEMNNAAENITIAHGMGGIPLVLLVPTNATPVVTLGANPYVNGAPDATNFLIGKGAATPSITNTRVVAIYHSILA